MLLTLSVCRTDIDIDLRKCTNVEMFYWNYIIVKLSSFFIEFDWRLLRFNWFIIISQETAYFLSSSQLVYIRVSLLGWQYLIRSRWFYWLKGLLYIILLFIIFNKKLTIKSEICFNIIIYILNIKCELKQHLLIPLNFKLFTEILFFLTKIYLEC